MTSRHRQGRSPRTIVAALALTILIPLGACVQTPPQDGQDPQETPSSAAPSVSSTPSASPDSTPLPTIPSPDFGFQAGGACRGEAVLSTSQPTPTDRSQLAALLLFETPHFPDLADRTDEPYVPVGTSYAWDPGGDDTLSNINALVCVSVVPDSDVVRGTCTAVYPDLQPDAWEVSTNYVVSIVDPTTAEVLIEGEPFSSAFIPGEVDCRILSPIGVQDEEYSYVSDMPTIRYWGAEVETVVNAFMS